MLTQIRDMPSGTVGFEAVGKVDDDDFSDTVEPVLRREFARLAAAFRSLITRLR